MTTTDYDPFLDAPADIRRAQELTCLAHVLACLDPATYDAKHGDGAHAADLAAIQAAAHQETP